MKGRLLFVLLVVAILLVMALPALPADGLGGNMAGVGSGVVLASGDPTPTPTPQQAECQGGVQC